MGYYSQVIAAAEMEVAAKTTEAPKEAKPKTVKSKKGARKIKKPIKKQGVVPFLTNKPKKSKAEKKNNPCREVRLDKLCLNICVGESGDKLTRAAKVSEEMKKLLFIALSVDPRLKRFWRRVLE